MTYPTTEMPTESPSTAPPTKSPAEPTTSPIDTPAPTIETDQPTDSGTTSPTSVLIGPTESAGLSVTLIGMTALPDIEEWELTTGNFYNQQYGNDRGVGLGVYDADVTIIYTGQAGSEPIRRRNRRLNASSATRELQTNSLVVTYTQITTYRTDDPNLNIEEIVEMPLQTAVQRDRYVGTLKRNTNGGYDQLTGVSAITATDDIPVDAPDSGEDGTEDAGGGGLNTGAIAGIAAGGAVVVVLAAGLVYYRARGGSGDNTNGAFASATAGTPSTGDPTRGTSSSLPTYGDTSVATVDYDYSRAYGNAGNHSLSDAGGTLGSRTRQTTGAEIPGSGNTIFSDDPTFDQAYENVREELIDVYAPAGKLGVVIDTPDDGAPVVHAVKDTSPISDKVQVGDKLVAVDGEDVRAMTAIKVSKLISKKSTNPSRKLTLIRHVSTH